MNEDDSVVQKYRLEEAQRAWEPALQAPPTPKQLARAQEISRRLSAPKMTLGEVLAIGELITAESWFDTTTEPVTVSTSPPSPEDPILAFLLTLPYPLKRADAFVEVQRQFDCGGRVFSRAWVGYPAERKLHGAPKGQRLRNRIRHAKRLA